MNARVITELLATSFDFLCLLLVKKTKIVVSLGYLTPSESCRGILWETAATIWRARLPGLFLQVHCSWAQSSSPDCCRLLTGDDGLPPRLLLLILLVWQDVACEPTFEGKLGHKIHKEHPIWHLCHKEKHADNRHERWRCGAGRVFHDRRFSWKLLY